MNRLMGRNKIIIRFVLIILFLWGIWYLYSSNKNKTGDGINQPQTETYTIPSSETDNSVSEDNSDPNDLYNQHQTETYTIPSSETD